MDLAQLDKIKKAFRTVLQEKSYWSIALFSIITVLIFLLLFNSNLEKAQKIVFLSIYIVYFLLYVGKSTQKFVYGFLSVVFSLIIISYTALDINNIIVDSISVYFSIMMFNYFAVRLILENFYKGKINKNIINTLSTLVFAILILYLVNKKIITNNTQILIVVIGLTILIEIFRRLFCFLRK